MNIQYISYISFALFLLGLFGASYCRSFLSIIVSFQFLILSSLINFLSFALFLYQSLAWDKTFIIFAFISVYILLFSIVFYNNSRQTHIYELDVLRDFRLFKPDKSDWWGDDKIDDN
ncbi:MAG: hypothetical protein FJW69_01275 [Actinobacteria bacterium]|nr:hypothetical protein [Actinomycetota bacterium]